MGQVTAAGARMALGQGVLRGPTRPIHKLLRRSGCSRGAGCSGAALLVACRPSPVSQPGRGRPLAGPESAAAAAAKRGRPSVEPETRGIQVARGGVGGQGGRIQVRLLVLLVAFKVKAAGERRGSLRRRISRRRVRSRTRGRGRLAAGRGGAGRRGGIVQHRHAVAAGEEEHVGRQHGARIGMHLHVLQVGVLVRGVLQRRPEAWRHLQETSLGRRPVGRRMALEGPQGGVGRRGVTLHFVRTAGAEAAPEDDIIIMGKAKGKVWEDGKAAVAQEVALPVKYDPPPTHTMPPPPPPTHTHTH